MGDWQHDFGCLAQTREDYRDHPDFCDCPTGLRRMLDETLRERNEARREAVRLRGMYAAEITGGAYVNPYPPGGRIVLPWEKGQSRADKAERE